MEISPRRLINKLKHRPLEFELKDAKALTEALRKKLLPNKIIRETAIEVLDLSEKGIFRSSAADGLTGYFNKRSRAKRQDRFWDKMQQNFRGKEGNIVVVAEGDSWFEHPFLQDIIDHINRNEDIAVFSLAYTADWLDNILYQGEYIDMLSVIKPDVFLVSAGGNDLLGDKKIGIMCRGIELKEVEKNVQNCPDHVYTEKIPKRFEQGLIELQNEGRKEEADDIREGVKYLTKEYFGFLNVMQWQYDYLFTCIRAKYDMMPIFTQSYDYATPQALIKRPLSLAYWYQYPINVLLQSGKWIETAMRNAEIYDTTTMHKVIKAMLYLFKSMVIETAGSFNYIYHIDSQGLTKPNEWFDEIHIKSHKFLQVGLTYTYAIKKAVEVRKQLIQISPAQSSPPVLPLVFKSIDNTYRPTFNEAFRAFWRERTFSWKQTGVQLLLFSLVFGLMFLLSEPLPRLQIPSGLAPKHIWNAIESNWLLLPFAYKLAVLVIVAVVIQLVYRLGRAVVLSIRYATIPSKINNTP
jgi:hypothetical protein